MSVAFLFPGQGAQSEGMLQRLPQHAEITRTLTEASKVLDLEVNMLDNSLSLQSTDTVQLALLIAGVATARALLAEEVVPAAVAGMSVGAFSAAVVCETLSFDDALRLVRLRGKLMQTAFPDDYGLAALVGLNELQVESLLKQIQTDQCPIYVSNVNAPQQIVVAGSDVALSSLANLATQQGSCQVHRLAISVPSHCPLLQPVADRLVQEMAKLPLRQPTIPYISNRGGRVLQNADAIRDDLATNVAHPVRWYDTLAVLQELGTILFLEMPPGHVSTQLVTQFFPNIHTVAISDQGLHYATVVAARENRSDF